MAILENDFSNLTEKQKDILQKEKSLASIYEYFNNTSAVEKNQEQEETPNNRF